MYALDCEPRTWSSTSRVGVDGQRRDEVASFLRARRARLSPENVGLDRGYRRRTPGLRREEVAAMAGVSVTWYTWLEQARPINVSADVVDALCRALRCDESEWRHVRRLIGLPAPLVERHGYDMHRIQSVVDALGAVPAVAVDRCLDVIVSNEVQAAIFGDPELLPPDRRNLLWWMFGDTEMRRVITDWDDAADLMVAWFRAECGKHPGDPRAAEVVEELSGECDAFRQRWERGEVKRFSGRRYTVLHPTWGPIALDSNQLRVVDQPGTIILLSMPGDDQAHDVLERIARRKARQAS